MGMGNPMGVALVSELQPGTEVREHTGFSNSRLTFHLALKVPNGDAAGIQVGGSHGSWKEGKVLGFDDSFPHSVWHRGDALSGPRTVLVLRAWHPDVTVEERQEALYRLAKE